MVRAFIAVVVLIGAVFAVFVTQAEVNYMPVIASFACFVLIIEQLGVILTLVRLSPRQVWTVVVPGSGAVRAAARGSRPSPDCPGSHSPRSGPAEQCLNLPEAGQPALQPEWGSHPHGSASEKCSSSAMSGTSASSTIFGQVGSKFAGRRVPRGRLHP